MRKKLAKLLAVLLLLTAALPLGAQAAHPAGYWPYLSAFNDAKASGDQNAILAKGEAPLSYYASAPLDKDVAGVRFTAASAMYPIYEARGNYEKAQALLAQAAAAAETLGYPDSAVNARTRAKKIDPMTQVYAVSDTAAAPYYGAKYEPRGATWYGRVMNGENGAQGKAEAAVSFYVELGSGQSTAQDFAWMIDPYDDGAHAIHIALNYQLEAQTPALVNSGSLDSEISATLRYLATLSSPVFLHIGGEMNLWGGDSAAFRQSYIHIAAMARSMAPNVALVFSPNCATAVGVKLADFYPGDSYVDWVGVSLYTNRYLSYTAGAKQNDVTEMYFGFGDYADPVKSIAPVVELAGQHSKPVMVTEGGSGWRTQGGEDLSAFAAQRVAELYGTLNMVYPQVKCIIYFDNTEAGYPYNLDGNAAVQSAYRAAVAGNPTLRASAGQDGWATFVPVTKFSEKTDKLRLRAYCDVIGQTVTAAYTLDGAAAGTFTAMPFALDLDAAALSVGVHTLKVTFSAPNGYRKDLSYWVTKYADGVVAVTDGSQAKPAGFPSDWAAKEVSAAIAAGIVPQTLQADYTANITRREFCALAMEMLTVRTGKTAETLAAEKGTETAGFTDCGDSQVLAACRLGIVSGVGNGKFAPDRSITRQEAAAMLTRAAKVLDLTAGGTAAAFADSGDVADWAKEPVDFVSRLGVMGGVGNGKFAPAGTYTREQAIMTMLRLFEAK